ncbi:hypothetical protein QYF36_009961 [Acer negundo]|nr:hypothetical protein QYF36_009961 [Acer negundo]
MMEFEHCFFRRLPFSKHLLVIFLIQQSAEHWRHTFCARLVSAGEFYPSKRLDITWDFMSLPIISNSSLVVMGIFDFTKVLSAQIPFYIIWFKCL